jgi:hypothetical protein
VWDEYQIRHDLQWKFREQHESDWLSMPSSRSWTMTPANGTAFALQIKSVGSGLERARQRGCWTYYGEKRHLMRWL